MDSNSHPSKHQIWEASFRSLDAAYKGFAPRAASRCLEGLLSDLELAEWAARQEHPSPPTKQVANELAIFLERLRARKRISEAVTLKAFLELSQHAQNILGAMLALETQGLVDNYPQINLDREDHHQALIAATVRARNWISENQGRPPRDYLDTFFRGVVDLFHKIPNSNVKVSNHRNGLPKTPFEEILYAGHQLINLNVAYHATVKAYDRFKARQ